MSTTTTTTTVPPAPSAAHVRPFLWLLKDALSHARLVASRASDALDGTQGALLFHNADLEINKFIEDSPAIAAIASAALADTFKGEKA